MANKVTGSYDITGAVSTLPAKDKVVCIIASKGTSAPTVSTNKLVDIYGTADAIDKFGTGAKIGEIVAVLIKNGVSMIKAVLVDSTTTPLATAYDNALQATLSDTSINIIITDSVDTTVFSKIKDNLDMAEDLDMFRYAVVGVSTPSDSSAVTTVAKGIGNKRVFLPSPNFLDDDGNEVAGYITAAGYASAIATETSDPALPLSGVEILGFGGVKKIMSDAEKTALINGGVTPIVLQNGRPAIYRAVTTNTTDTVWQEVTTIMVADDVLSDVETRLKQNYKRTKNVVRILNSVRTDVLDVLERKKALEIIDDYDKDSTVVRKDPNNLYGALVEYGIDIVTPLYTITIKQSIKL